MVRKRTRQVSEVSGNAEPLLLDELTPVSTVELKPEIEVDGVLFEDADLSGVEAASVRLADVALRGVDLSGTELKGLRLVDVLAIAVTAANGSWRHVHMSRVTFDSSTLVGLDLAESQLGATTFSECKLDLANLRMSTLRHYSLPTSASWFRTRRDDARQPQRRSLGSGACRWTQRACRDLRVRPRVARCLRDRA
jgi:uncharacterized protein YjbI with pentapeptide repeats